MASRQSRRGQHVESPGFERDFNIKSRRLRDIVARLERARLSPKKSVQLYGGGDREREQRTRQWRTARNERFTGIQQRAREWINCAEIAEWCSEESGIAPNEVARGAAYKKFQRDLLEGDFEENGRSRVLYLHPHTSKARMTRDWLTRLMGVYDQTTINLQYLAHCWIPQELFDQWLAKHRMQARPERFEPKWPRPSATIRRPLTQDRKSIVPVVIAEGVKLGASNTVRKGRPGPEPGTLRRYEAADRQLFPELERIMKEGNSRSAAALDLVQAKKVKGIGTDQSRAKRLAALYKRERGGTSKAVRQEAVEDPLPTSELALNGNQNGKPT
jgi:hypothetical protein